MLQLTKRTEYGLIALVYMVGQDGTFVSAREISEFYAIPRRLLAEVLKDLCRASLVASQRGATGGYALAHAADVITVGDVVGALEGAPTLAGCENSGPRGPNGASSGECDLEPQCPIRSPLHRLRESIWRQMHATSLLALTTSTLPVVQPRLPDLSANAAS